VTVLLNLLLHSALFIFFYAHLLIKLIEQLLSRNGKITIVYHDMMLMTKHCSSIYFRCKTAVIVFTLLVRVMLLLLTDLTSVPHETSIGVKYCQNLCEKVSPIPISTLHTKSIADTCAGTQKVSPIL